MRFKVPILILSTAICALLILCSLGQVRTWYGAHPVELSILIVSRDTGNPIPGADVELIHPYDDERPKVRGRSSADGRVVLRNHFTAGGTEIRSFMGEETSEHVTFRPWLIHVQARGFSEFRASMGETDARPDLAVTDIPLNLRYPVAEPITIALRPSKHRRRAGQDGKDQL
jgi:hypothetical protein